MWANRSAPIMLLAGICLAWQLSAAQEELVLTDTASAAATVRVQARDTLSGPLPRVLYADQGPYFVLGNIVVPQGQTVIIEAGTVLLFNAFTGIKVQGTLFARGESDKPIVFTSANDAAHNPASTIQAAPYDWNGIQISADGIGSHFNYCLIRYSVYGIASMTRYIRIGPTLFQHNGRANLTVDGLEHQTGDSPYEYNATAPMPLSGTGDSLLVLSDPRGRPRAIIRYSSLGVTLLGALVSGVYSARFAQSNDRVDELSGTDAANLSSHTGAEWQSAYSRARSDRRGMVWGIIIGTAGAAGFTYSFFF